MADGIRNRTFLGVSWLAAAVVAGCSAPVPERSGATASPPASRVEPARTQPPGGELLDSERLGQTLQALSANDRVTVERIGTSAGGRPIWMAIVTAPGADLTVLRRRARDISGPDVAYDRVSSARVRTRDVATALAEARLPVLVAGASWGHEAAQVEGLVGAIETLANDRSPDIERALRRTVALIVPLMNPDGRDRAVAEWKTTPRSNGESAVGNAAGLMLNRDFVHQTQPESAAMLRVIRDWRPVVGIDEHEDVNRLGVAMEETAFVPPYMTGFDVEETSDGRQAITRVGDAIAKRWKAAGYPIVHDAAGDTKWVPMPPRGSGELNPVAGSSGRLEFLFNVHGIVGLITESARTPGTQTWQARVDQKRLAALAAIDAVAADPAYFATTVYERRLKATTDAANEAFLAIPHEQRPGADRAELRRLLRAHDVLVYETSVGSSPSSGFDIVPLGQPEQPFIRHALLSERSKLNDLPAALGVRAIESSNLAEPLRRQLASAPLHLVSTSEIAWPRTTRTVRPVFVYSGQGVEGANLGEVTFVLDALGTAWRPVTADEVRRGALPPEGALVVPDANVRELLEGWDLAVPTRRAPWQWTETPTGLGRDGAAALAAFVRGGGALVAIERSTLLARAAGLLDVTSLSAAKTIAQVKLRPADGTALFANIGTDEDGTVRGFVYAPAGGEGYAYSTLEASAVAATYDGAVIVEAEQSASDVELFSAARHATAIVDAPVGKGRVSLFGIDPVFRAQWRRTFPLLVHALRP